MRTIARLAGVVGIMSLLAMAPGLVLGHVELIESSPAAGSTLDSAPSEVTITFDDELQPAASSFTVSDADGDPVGTGDVDLTVADRNVLRGDVDIADPGVYTVAYSVAGIDGHQIDGSFSFGFDTDAEIPDPTGGEEQPDTALPAPAGGPSQLIGSVLLLVGLAVAARRMAAR